MNVRLEQRVAVVANRYQGLMKSLGSSSHQLHDFPNFHARGARKLIANVGDEIYLLTDGGAFLRYDIEEKFWEDLGGWGSPGEWYEIVVFQGCIFVVVKYHTKFYDIDEEDWFGFDSSAGVKLRFFSLAASDSHIYAVGGTIGNVYQYDQVKRLDIETGLWTSITPMRTARTGIATAFTAGKLFVMGGSESDRDISMKIVECYDPITELWSEVSSMSVPRNYANACVVDGKIFAVGGATDGYCKALDINSIESYDPEKDEWKIVAIGGGLQPGPVHCCSYYERIYEDEEETKLSSRFSSVFRKSARLQ